MDAPRDPRVDAFIEKAAPFAQPILRHLRELVHAACPETVEAIKWSMPFFLYRGKNLCGMAAFKAHCVFVLPHVEVAPDLAKYGREAEAGMGHLGRITRLEDLPPPAELRRYLRMSAALIESGPPSRPKPQPRAELPVPADLAAALKKNQAAAATFAKFSPSHRREYVVWITEAKRPEARARRVAATLAQLAEGKSRHWKYQPS